VVPSLNVARDCAFPAVYYGFHKYLRADGKMVLLIRS